MTANRVINIIIGGLIVGLGIIVYPYYINYIWTPVLRPLFLGVISESNTILLVFIKFMPFMALGFILFLGILFMTNRGKTDNTGGGNG